MRLPRRKSQPENNIMRENGFALRLFYACVLLVILRVLNSVFRTSSNKHFLVYISETSKFESSLELHQWHCTMEPCNLNLVFLGDSVTRYMFVSLMHFLKFNNTWIDCKDNPNYVVAQSFFEVYETKTHWTAYYEKSFNFFYPNLNCDCYRSAPFDAGKTTENWYFYDPIRNNTITYIQAFGKLQVHGHWPDPYLASRQSFMMPRKIWNPKNESESMRNNTKNIEESLPNKIPQVGPMQTYFEPTWSGDWVYAIQTHISQLRPDALIMNAGHWPHLFNNPKERQKVYNATQEVGIPRVIWKTTNPTKTKEYKKFKIADDGMCALMECMNMTGWINQYVPPEKYHDRVHFYEPVYRVMSEQLLNMLGVKVHNSAFLNWSDIAKL